MAERRHPLLDLVALRRETGGAWTHEKIFPRRDARRARMGHALREAGAGGTHGA